ncbi:MAG: ribonucleoside-diphosphate reductase subunit alpha [Pseudomonadales bacterium]|jgi:ribonucleoside-diphosphate reductase alpha chain|nr:ribonucleoside-diphosphate reductase subunit alpha [Pseudomonadales bacterium]MDP6472001.1 ribonucleoside-diphosphate reductase subunit alpha [Pseudomonadales bacterium]MDP6826728.1 ribonucleoside-diphosphate reductase subunit alpha [Pseudomonadales bacterium]MDP6972662.1 ribonucleoside-diphosphate reductase subunit alpha [Pseudomonadales bacterium]
MHTESTDTTQQPPVVDAASALTPSLAATAPGQLKVIKRNGTVVPYTEDKIHVAITKAFLAVEGGTAAASPRIRELVSALSDQVGNTFRRRLPSGGTLHIEDIQDQVELALMRSGQHKVARSYVLYREERARAREADAVPTEEHSDIGVIMPDGSRRPLDVGRIRTLVSEACEGLADVDGGRIIEQALNNMYDGISASDVATSLLITARTLVEEEPNYTYVTSRLLLDELRTEALAFLDVRRPEAEPGDYRATQSQMLSLYPRALAAFITRGIELELIDPKLAKYDMAALGAALKPERDELFTYLGLQTLYDRYFIHSDETRFELPQVFFMRVAMGLAHDEDGPVARAIEFYDLLSSFDYMSSTPTLFNAGTLRPQLSSCFLTTVPDNLEGIYGAIRDNALLSKWAGGLGNDWTPIRALGSYIKGTNGKSQGLVPFLKVVNDTAVAVNQGGKRKGAVCAYLETWHLDIEEFLELRKNTGDDRRRTHDMNTANWIPDLFMKRVTDDGEWTLFSPNEVPDLHDLYGKAFEVRYEAYEEMTRTGEITLFKRVKASDLWRKMLSMLFETGHPWMTFKDSCNTRSPQQHIGVVHSSNLCTEITLNTSEEEIAVCNLGSVNLVNHVEKGELNHKKLKKTIHNAVRMLDNVIDINYYSVDQARTSNLRHRPVGLGIMGFQDALYKLRIPYGSNAAVEFADRSMEAVSYFAIDASSRLAKERGSYASFSGSLWSRGIMPIDSLKVLQAERGEAYLDTNFDSTLDWDKLRAKVQINGMRNSNVMAIAPTATIANISGVSQSIEPTYQNLYVKSNLSGEFTVVNPFMVHDLKAAGLWDEVMVNDLKYYDGSLTSIDRVPDDLKALYATAFEVEPRWLVDAASRRQKWIDQAQSLNLYIAGASGKKLDVTYRMAWLRGLKTTYYLRALGATSAEKSTLDRGELNAVSATQETPGMSAAASDSPAPVSRVSGTGESEFADAAPVPLACSLDDPDCETCQ